MPRFHNFLVGSHLCYGPTQASPSIVQNAHGKHYESDEIQEGPSQEI